MAGGDVDSTLVELMGALSRGGFWAKALDIRWRTVALTDELAAVHADDVLFGSFMFGPEQLERFRGGRGGGNSLEENRETFRRVGGWVLTDLQVGRDDLREAVHPDLRDLVEEIEPTDADTICYEHPASVFGGTIGAVVLVQRVRDSTGRVVGTVIANKPAVGMTTMAVMTASGDLEHFNRMMRLSEARRRPAAVMFADLEGSAQLSKRMPTAAYFKLIRRITRTADQCVIDAGGLVGRHAGDGVAAFFVAESLGASESSAARACISAAKALQTSMADVAERHDLSASDVTVRAGLHWGATLHIGSIITPGRTEVTALGDAVNEAARIEACASGGRVLASKDLIERLDLADAALLGLDPERISYTQLADLETATEKARRDAPAIPVCDLASVAH